MFGREDELQDRIDQLVEKNYRLEAEFEKCKASPYYFYTNHFMVNGKKATTPLSEEDFNSIFKKK